jgi:hypothetical protein
LPNNIFGALPGIGAPLIGAVVDIIALGIFAALTAFFTIGFFIVAIVILR